jgi:capsular polysaccharide transport system ATP-binding protein
MIELAGVCKWYPTRQGRYIVLDGVDLRVRPGEKVGILGRNGAGKSTLIRILSGTERPNAGQVRREMTLSWPLAFSGGFQGSLSGLDNLKFICRVYGVDYRNKTDPVQAFAELGEYFREPVKNYSSGMRSRLAFAISFAIEFDCYLIDETLSVGDARFRDRCREELFEKRKDRAMVMVSHEAAMVKKHCDRAFILDKGCLQSYDDLALAIETYQTL